MLVLTEFSVGRLCDATPMSLFLPSSKYQPTALVFGHDEEKLLALILDGQHAFVAFDCSTNKAWQGILVHNGSIEVDEKSLFHLDRYDQPLGSLFRKGGKLSVAAKQEDGFRTAHRVDLIDGLPASNDETQAGFTRWCVVIGEGPNRRELFLIDRPTPNLTESESRG
jgi:hypothetical protein